MNDQVEYHVIAKALVDGAPKGWTEITLDAEVGDGYVDSGCRAEIDGATTGFRVASGEQTQIEDALIKLHRSTLERQGSTWATCVFRVRPDGQFKFDVAYND